MLSELKFSALCSVDNKSAKELRQYLQHLSEQAASGDNSVLPCVVVLDNLHKAGPLADALGSLPRNLPCLLGTMAQSACSATSLQLQHGFRFVTPLLCRVFTSHPPHPRYLFCS